MSNPLTQAYSGGAGSSSTAPAPVSPGAARRPSRVGTGKNDKISTDPVKNAVRTMQQLMNKLNTDMQTGNAASIALEKIQEANKGSLPEAFNSVEKIKIAVRPWGATSAGGTTGAFDGIWGPNTKAQLERIKSFISDTGLPGMIIQEGNGTSPYREMNPDDLKKIAEDNIANLSRLFEALGMSSPNISGKSANLSSFSLDRIKRELTTEDAITPKPWSADSIGDVRVTVGDMRSFVRFFQFIQTLKYTPCRPLEGSDRSKDDRNSVDDFETIANIILDGSLIRLAQTATERSARGQSSGEAANRSYQTNKAERESVTNKNISDNARSSSNIANNKPTDDMPSTTGTNGQWHCFYTIDEILRWFSSRARMVLTQVQDLISEHKPHPFYPERIVNSQDEAAASAYLAASNGLWEQWNAMKDNVLRQIQNKGPQAENNPQVTLDMIMKGGAGTLPTPGAARRRGEGYSDSGRGGATATTVSTEDNVENRNLLGPIKEFMPLNWLIDSGFKADTIKLEKLSRNGSLPDIHRQVWRGGNWINIAINSINGRSNTEKLQKFPQWAGLVRDAIYDLYSNWESENREKLNEKIISQQNRELNRWGDTITSIITRAQMNMSDAIGMYGEQKQNVTRM